MAETKEDQPAEKRDREWYVQRFQDEKLNQVMTLQSGKRISFAEVGPEDGVPVFVFPGLGGSRQFLILLEKPANENGLRLISPDRPGIGLSDDAEDNEQKQPLAWPDTVVEVADHLHIEKFGLLGQSCGCVYALACALKIPQRILGEVYLLCPWIPLSVPGTKGMLRMAQHAPSFLVGASTNIMSSFSSMMCSMGSLNLIKQGWSESERKCFDKTFFEVYIETSDKEKKSGFKNAVMMCMEKYGSWNFKYEDVEFPCHLFHGDKDTMVPLAAAEWIAGAMPNCKLTVFPDATHNALMDKEKMESVFRQLAESLLNKHDKDVEMNNGDSTTDGNIENASSSADQ